jgi:hypothetical protein
MSRAQRKTQTSRRLALAKEVKTPVASLQASPTPISPVAQPKTAEVAPQLPALEAVIDGRRVVLDARDEIVLRCGKATITLRSNGRIVIRGTYIETHSAGVNRIKGGSVQIN